MLVCQAVTVCLSMPSSEVVLSAGFPHPRLVSTSPCRMFERYVHTFTSFLASIVQEEVASSSCYTQPSSCDRQMDPISRWHPPSERRYAKEVCR